MTLRLQRRPAFGWPATRAPSANTNRGMAIHYEGGRTGIADWPHSRCIAHWNATRVFHMGPSRGWIDIGYAWGICPHYVLEGRGGFRSQAAQPGGNTTWESATFMTGPGEAIHPRQIENFRALRAWRRSNGVAAAIRPHSSFVSTGCPGDILRRMISDGTLVRKPASPPQEDDMPLTDADIEKIANRSSERTLERLANEGGALAMRARDQIARQVLYRTHANLYLPTRPDGTARPKEAVNLFTALFRDVQQTVAIADALTEHVMEPAEPPIDEPADA